MRKGVGVVAVALLAVALGFGAVAGQGAKEVGVEAPLRGGRVAQIEDPGEAGLNDDPRSHTRRCLLAGQVTTSSLTARVCSA
jgi:hypothetical protein